jgi:hypothetical protein
MGELRTLVVGTMHQLKKGYTISHESWAYNITLPRTVEITFSMPTISPNLRGTTNSL